MAANLQFFEGNLFVENGCCLNKGLGGEFGRDLGLKDVGHKTFTCKYSG